MATKGRHQKSAVVDGRATSSRATSSSLLENLERLATGHARALTWAVGLFPLAFVLVMILGKLLAPVAYSALIVEDGAVEYGTFFVYLIAAGFVARLALDLGRQAKKFYAFMYWVLSAGLFFIAMEEISWGQRTIGIKTPEFLEDINRQSEMTFHNIEGFPLHLLYVLVGAYGAFARVIVPGVIKRRYPVMIDLLTVPRFMFLYFFLPFLLYSYYEYLDYSYRSPLGLEWSEVFTEASFVDGHDQEPIELLLSFGFLLFVLRNWHRYRQVA